MCVAGETLHRFRGYLSRRLIGPTNVSLFHFRELELGNRGTGIYNLSIIRRLGINCILYFCVIVVEYRAVLFDSSIPHTERESISDQLHWCKAFVYEAACPSDNPLT